MKGSKVLGIVVEEIVRSYDLKVKTVIPLIRQVNQEIKNCHAEQELMINRLKDMLAKNECLRKKDFDTMMSGVRNQQEAREKEVSQMVEDFCKEEEEMVAKLKEIFTVKSSSTLENIKILKEKMLSRTKEREIKIVQMLKDFHCEQDELSVALEMLLEKGHSVRIKDFRAMVKAFHIEHKYGNTEVDRILEGFEKVKDGINNQWQRVMAIVGIN